MNPQEKQFLTQLGRHIANLRKANGYSQLDICAEIKMEKSNLSAIENGRQNATSLSLLKIAKAIGVKVSDLFNFEFTEEAK